MSTKSVEELTAMLERMKERQAQLREELAAQKKKADAKAAKELAHKKYILADYVIRIFGEEVLDNPNLINLQHNNGGQTNE